MDRQCVCVCVCITEMSQWETARWKKGSYIHIQQWTRKENEKKSKSMEKKQKIFRNQKPKKIAHTHKEQWNFFLFNSFSPPPFLSISEFDSEKKIVVRSGKKSITDFNRIHFDFSQFEKKTNGTWNTHRWIW